MYSNVFSSFGGFAPTPAASTLFNKSSEISYDTSSRDPSALRARVFVGSLNTNRVTRDDVIQMFKSYGTLAGVTLFKGYAFVQYSNLNEADLAVSALNGYNWNGSVLDVKLAANGMKPSTTLGSTTSTTTKRSSDLTTTAKRVKTESSARDINAENKLFVSNLSDEIDDIVDHSKNADTLICGECRFITSNISEFIKHRKEPCLFFKSEGEPLKLKCFSCTEEFVDSWSLVQHLTSTHKLTLYKTLTNNSSQSNNGGVSATNGNGESEEAANDNGNDNGETVNTNPLSLGCGGLEAEDDDSDEKIGD